MSHWEYGKGGNELVYVQCAVPGLFQIYILANLVMHKGYVCDQPSLFIETPGVMSSSG